MRMNIGIPRGLKGHAEQVAKLIKHFEERYSNEVKLIFVEG